MIFADDSDIKIDSLILPGVIKSIEIKGEATVDEQDVEGQSKKPKQATGYEDIKINIELILEDAQDTTKLQKLETIQNIFRPPGQEKPSVHELINEQTAARGVKRVIFKNLTHKAENKKGQMAVSIELWEYNPITITAQAKTKSGSKKSAGKTGTAGGAGAIGNLNADYQKYLDSRGTAPVLNKSPAQDNASGEDLLAAIKKLPF